MTYEDKLKEHEVILNDVKTAAAYYEAMEFPRLTAILKSAATSIEGLIEMIKQEATTND